jgi:hypothetical protein
MDRHDGAACTIAQESTAMNELDGRTVVILPGSGDDLRGPARTIALTAEARWLADAIVGALDKIDLFEIDGALVLLADGGLTNVNGDLLRAIIRANFVGKCLVTTGTVLGVEFHPIEVSELVVWTLLTASPNEGGLLGRVPPVQVEAPRQSAEPAESPGQVVRSPETEIEIASGQKAAVKHAVAGGERLKLEVEQGQRRSAQFQT